MGFSLKKLNSSIASGFGSIGGILNGITGVTESQDRTYEQQRKAMQEQNAYNTYMWNLQNQYNTPMAQLARMAEAGIDINPTSYALGTGNLSNTAALVGSASGFSGNGSPAGNPISALMGVAQGIQGVRESKQRVANMEEQNINLMEQGNLLFNQTEGSRIANEIARHNLSYAKERHKPVGFTPQITGDPIGYVGGYVGDYMKGMMGY